MVIKLRLQNVDFEQVEQRRVKKIAEKFGRCRNILYLCSVKEIKPQHKEQWQAKKTFDMYNILLPSTWAAATAHYYTTREEWLAARKGGIGASDVAAICGLSAWSTPLQVWLRIRGETPFTTPTAATKMGHKLEPIVAELWEEETGLRVDPASVGDIIVRVNDPEQSWLQCSPDRWTAEGVLLECKTTAAHIDDDCPPIAWVIQLQYQMAVCGAAEGWLAWLVNGREFGCKRYARDKEVTGLILARVEEFWRNNVVAGIAPALASVEDVKLRYPAPVQESLEADEALAGLIAELRQKRAELKIAEAEVGQLEEAVKVKMATAGRLEYGGRVLATFSANKPSRVLDVKILQMQHPEIYEQCLVERAGTRVLRIK